MNQSTKARLRRARRARAKIKRSGKHRLSVHRSNNHTYAQLFAPNGGDVIVSVSTKTKGVLAEGESGGNVAAAEKVGKAIAKAALDKGVESVAFDRSGFIYHGRVKAVAEAAREAGLKF
ncbi:MAG TPA: 50S ribosomal protein L18 [Halothiobacillaceae bacterium]|nr:50S ribosomal protein L18 [Halothiobacillaceae bacterium]